MDEISEEISRFVLFELWVCSYRGRWLTDATCAFVLIQCMGFRRFLLGGALGTENLSWGEFLELWLVLTWYYVPLAYDPTGFLRLCTAVSRMAYQPMRSSTSTTYPYCP